MVRKTTRRARERAKPKIVMVTVSLKETARAKAKRDEERKENLLKARKRWSYPQVQMVLRNLICAWNWLAKVAAM
jgi:hypothetical protein